MKTIGDQGEKQIKALEDHRKHLVKSLTLLKQKEIFEELANERIDEIQNISQQTDFNILVYYFKDKSGSKNFIGFKGPFGFYKNRKDGDTTLEKAEENKKKLNQI